MALKCPRLEVGRGWNSSDWEQQASLKSADGFGHGQQ